jgi:uncharacterized protein (TIGR04255 family)
VNALNLDAILDEAYQHKEPVILSQVQFAGGTAKTVQKSLGWCFRNADGVHIYQARLNGFGVSRLAPYQDWRTFSGEARRLWNRYCDMVKPGVVQRLGLRYINRIDIPLPLDDFGEYLITAPLVSPHLPQGLSNYVMSLTIPIDDVVTAAITEAILNQNAVPNQAFVPPVRPNTVSILLDIDVSQMVSDPVTEDQVWERFEELRKIKNHVFESCITDRTRELFQ